MSARNYLQWFFTRLSLGRRFCITFSSSHACLLLSHVCTVFHWHVLKIVISTRWGLSHRMFAAVIFQDYLLLFLPIQANYVCCHQAVRRSCNRGQMQDSPSDGTQGEETQGKLMQRTWKEKISTEKESQSFVRNWVMFANSSIIWLFDEADASFNVISV